ncbi:MAG TPA: DNA-binding response regulator [Cytophagales bacterium]|nr:DNA-binding response regulator [Cytophagales bacterium]HCR55018.1 DNA-binding response regulator [Cytophagales bacterium]
MIKCAIVDDEELARTLLTEYVQRMPQLELIGQFKNPIDLIKSEKIDQLDLLFLDIQMPTLTGIDFLKGLKNKPTVIFTTAYPDYALEGYQLDVADYLVKPISFERFLYSVQKVSPQITGQEYARQGNAFISINSGHKIFRIQPDNILYIEGLKEYVSYFTEDGQRIVALESLKKLSETLPHHQFVRIHKSYIVNISKVKVVEGNQVQIGTKKIPIGASYKEAAMKMIL